MVIENKVLNRSLDDLISIGLFHKLYANDVHLTKTTNEMTEEEFVYLEDRECHWQE